MERRGEGNSNQPWMNAVLSVFIRVYPWLNRSGYARLVSTGLAPGFTQEKRLEMALEEVAGDVSRNRFLVSL